MIQKHEGRELANSRTFTKKLIQQPNPTTSPAVGGKISNRIEFALDYQARGYTPLPIPRAKKNPGFKNWQKYQAVNGQLERDFRGEGNIGLLLGKPSNWLIDVDLDWPEAWKLAPKLLPDTQAQSGRQSAPHSHYWYHCEIGTTKFSDPTVPKGDGDRAMIAEIRSTGCQTVVAPSVHPSGERYEWAGELTPACVDAEALRQAVARLAACALIARHWPQGRRHDAALALAGVLLRNGWNRRDVDHFVLSAATVAGDDEIEDRAKAVATTDARILNGESVTGLPTLIEILGEKTVNALVKWLGLRSRNEGAPTRAKESQKPQQKKQQVGSISFHSSEKGVYATDDEGTPIWICSQLEIEADTRDEHNDNWGRLLKFPDRDGVPHQWAMPMSLLSGDGREYRERLLEQGLVIASGRKARTLLENYLNMKPEKKALCVTKQGWHRGAFVLPDEMIGENGEPIYLQTLSANHLFRQSGTIEEWREKIGQYCAGNSRLALATSIAFAAPLLEPLQGESGGWHLTGPSSTGKTTALNVAGSVHGGGGDKGFIRRWRATINGLETVAEAHHDALLCLDEIAECRPDDVNEAAYMLANGQGKARQARGGALRRTLEWRLAFLSSGEISIADHVAQTGKRVRAGQEVRVINLPADAEKGLGLFEELHGFSTPDEFARHLQRASRDYYGAPIRAFLRGVAGKLDDLRRRYRVFETEMLAEMLPEDAGSEVSRVAHRFALAAFAGELATDAGITGWQPDEATAAAKTLFAAWLSARGTSGSTDEEAALRQVRKFIELHGQSRFQQLSSTSEKIINRAGYVGTAGDNPEDGLIYYVLPEIFRSEICAGFGPTSVAKWLNARGWLRTNDKLQYRVRAADGQPRTYAILSVMLD